MTMTGRERILRAIKHEEADRVPIDFGGMRSTGIMAIAYNQLKKHLGLAGGETRIFDTMQQLALVEPEILAAFGADVVPLDLGNYAPNGWRPYRLPDGSGGLAVAEFNPVAAEDGGWEVREGGRVVSRRSKDSLYFDTVHHPLAGAERPEDLDGYQWWTLTEGQLAYLRQEARRLHETTGYAVMASFGGNILETGHTLFGYEKFMIELALRTPLVEAFLERLTAVHLGNLRKYLAAVGDYVQIIQFGDDLGTQHGPAISPVLYRDLIKRRHAQLYQYVHQHSACHVFLHSCGAIHPLLGDLIEAGVDIINPVQIGAAGMEPERLKREFGRDLTFWGGGCDTQRTLPFGTEQEVRDEVRRMIEIFAPGGGYVFNQVHNIQANIPPAKVVALYETAKAAGERAYRGGS